MLANVVHLPTIIRFNVQLPCRRDLGRRGGDGQKKRPKRPFLHLPFGVLSCWRLRTLSPRLPRPLLLSSLFLLRALLLQPKNGGPKPPRGRPRAATTPLRKTAATKMSTAFVSPPP